MIYIKSGLRFILNNIAINLIIIIQIALSCYLINSILVYKDNIDITLTVTKDLDNDLIYYMTRQENFFFMQDTDQLLENIEYDYSIYYKGVFYSYNNIDIYGYSDYLFEHINLPLYKGEQKTCGDRLYGIATFNSNLDIGDTAKVYDKYNNEYDLTISGILPDTSLYPSLSSGGKPMIMEMLFKNIDDKPMILIPHDSIIDDSDSFLPSFFININDNITQEERQIIINDLSSNGWVNTLEEIRTNSLTEKKDTLMIIIPIIVISLILLILMVLIVILYTININKKYISIMLIAGAKKKDAMLALLSYFIIVITISIIIFVTISKLLQNPFTYIGLYINNNYVVLCSIMAYIIYLTTTIIASYTTISKETLIQQYKGAL